MSEIMPHHSPHSPPSTLKKASDFLLRVYAVGTLIVAGVFIYEKYFVEFEDVVYYAPTVFIQDSFTVDDDVSFYSWIGTPSEGTPLIISDPLFCQAPNGRWERVVLPVDKVVSLKVDKSRNALIHKSNALLFEFGDVNSNEVVDFVRKEGDRQSDLGLGFAIKYDISKADVDVPTTCRIVVYLTTETQFFNHVKTEKYYSSKFRLLPAE